MALGDHGSGRRAVLADKRGRETLLDGDAERELAALLACHDARRD